MTEKKEAVARCLFSLIRSEVCGGEASSEDARALPTEWIPVLYRLAKAHDLSHLVASRLQKLGMLGADEVSAKFQKQMMLSVYRYEQSRHELGELCRVLEEGGIPHLPLKGAILRDYYPEPWMRTSCDLDILVRREDCERAVACLAERLQYRKEAMGSHDVSLFTPSEVHIELHFELNEENYRVFESLTEVWSHARRVSEESFRYEMPDALFYFYHIAHMAKHFETGGCGVRPLLDLWILDHRVEHDESERDALLEREGLLTFANACRDLSEVWFSGKEKNALTEQMTSYILDGGVYGTVENKVAVQQTKQGGKLRYALRRIFVPYETMKIYYPVLEQKKWLTPFFEVRRWFRLLFGGKVKRSLHELNANQAVTTDQQKQTQSLLSQLGL